MCLDTEYLDTEEETEDSSSKTCAGDDFNYSDEEWWSIDLTSPDRHMELHGSTQPLGYLSEAEFYEVCCVIL